VTLYRGMDRAALDAAYNNRAAVRDYPAISAQRQKRSDEVRAARRFRADLAYGGGARERLDFFSAAAADAPVLAFIHGGYWQWNDKDASSFLVEGPLALGFSVALIEYTLAPAASIDQGGHLCATLLDHPAAAGVLAISGLFDLEPIRLCYLNDKLALTPESVSRNSPLLNVPRRAAPCVVTVGAAELPELVRQSAEYAAALAERRLRVRHLPLAVHDHFTVLDELAKPEGALCAALVELDKR